MKLLPKYYKEHEKYFEIIEGIYQRENQYSQGVIAGSISMFRFWFDCS